MNYYIVDGNNNLGPFDLVVLIRKVRNGQILPDTMLLLEGEDVPLRAIEVEDIQSLFSDGQQKADHRTPSVPVRMLNLEYTASMSKGLKFIQTHQQAMLYAAAFVLITLLSIKLLAANGYSPVATGIIFFIAHFTLSAIMLAIFRLNRGQPLSIGYLIGIITKSLMPLLALTGIVTISSMALPLLAAFILQVNMLATIALFTPALFIVTLYIFVPLHISEQRMGLVEAMRASAQLVTAHGMNSTGVIFALVMTNIILGIPVLTLIVTIPITLSAIAEIYEEATAL